MTTEISLFGNLPMGIVNLPPAVRTNPFIFGLVMVAAGSRHATARDREGRVFTWGIHAVIWGQLGRDPMSGKETWQTPYHSPLPEPARAIDAMANYTYITTLLVPISAPPNKSPLPPGGLIGAGAFLSDDPFEGAAWECP